MKKFKKYTYPFVFSICFFVTYIVLVIVLNIVLSSGDYAGLAYAGIALIIWILVITPVYCVKYSKIIQNEKLKFLFAVYNAFVIALCHIGPFLMPAISGSDVDILITIAVVLFSWVAILTIVPLVSQLISRKSEEKDALNET